MPSFSIDKINSLFEDILSDQALLVHETEMAFGHRLGSIKRAAVPKGMMPMAEAQALIANFETQTKKLRSFINGLGSVQEVPADMKAEYTALYTKASKALDKFTEDQKKAQIDPLCIGFWACHRVQVP